MDYSEFILDLQTYIHTVIDGIESSIFKLITSEQPDKIKLLKSKHQPFIELFSELHTEYFTTTHNSIINNDNAYITLTFNNLCDKTTEYGGPSGKTTEYGGPSGKSKHSKKCILTIVANLIVSVHFNMDRTKLDYVSLGTYIKSVRSEITEILSEIDIEKLFDHKCDLNPKMILLGPGEKFIDINISQNNS